MPRRPSTATVATGLLALLVVLAAVADPSALIAPVGWPGGAFRLDVPVWVWAPHLVGFPVMCAGTWLLVRRSSGGFWATASSVLVAVVLAKVAVSVVALGLRLPALWSGAHAVGKALPLALLVALLVRVTKRCQAVPPAARRTPPARWRCGCPAMSVRRWTACTCRRDHRAGGGGWTVTARISSSYRVRT